MHNSQHESSRTRGGVHTNMRGQRCGAVLAAFLTAFSCGLTTQAETIDKVVAVVDREVILQSDLVGEALPAIREIQDAAGSQEEFERQVDALLREVLESQIESKLLFRQAQFTGQPVTDEDVEESIAQRRGDMTYDEFLQFVREQGYTMDELRERVREDILAGRLARYKRNEFERDVVITEEEVLEFYEMHRADYERPEEVLVSQIQLQVGDDPAERAKARARLEALRREIEAGANFADLARLHSQDMFAENGGSMGWHERGVLQPVLEDAAFALEVGEVSGVIETRAGLHLLRVDDRREPGLRTMDEMRSEIEPQLRRLKALQRYETWLSDLRKRSRVRVFL